MNFFMIANFKLKMIVTRYDCKYMYFEGKLTDWRRIFFNIPMFLKILRFLSKINLECNEKCLSLQSQNTTVL